MKTLLNRIAFALLITALASVAAFAKGKTEKATFPTNIKVNGTLVKEGVYDLKFDEQTGELTILKGSKVIAKANTSAAKRDRKAQSLEIRTSGSGDDTQLTSVAFSGSDQNLMINGTQAKQ